MLGRVLHRVFIGKFTRSSRVMTPSLLVSSSSNEAVAIAASTYQTQQMVNDVLHGRKSERKSSLDRTSMSFCFFGGKRPVPFPRVLSDFSLFYHFVFCLVTFSMFLAMHSFQNHLHLPLSFFLKPRFLMPCVNSDSFIFILSPPGATKPNCSGSVEKSAEQQCGQRRERHIAVTCPTGDQDFMDQRRFLAVAPLSFVVPPAELAPDKQEKQAK